MELNIKIKDNIASVISKDNNNLVTTKDISIVKLCQILAAGSRSSKTVVPAGCRMVYESHGKKMFVFIRPPFIGPAAMFYSKYDEESYGKLYEYKPDPNSMYAMRGAQEGKGVRVFTIPFPATAIGVVVNCPNKDDDTSYRFVNMYAFAIKDIMMPMDNYELCVWPFTNVFSSYNVCLGDIPYVYNSIDSLANIPNYFFSGINNHDLASGVCKREPDNASLGVINDGFEFMVKLRDKTVFPTEYLKPLGPIGGMFDALAAKL